MSDAGREVVIRREVERMRGQKHCKKKERPFAATPQTPPLPNLPFPGAKMAIGTHRHQVVHISVNVVGARVAVVVGLDHRGGRAKRSLQERERHHESEC